MTKPDLAHLLMFFVLVLIIVAATSDPVQHLFANVKQTLRLAETEEQEATENGT